MKKTKNSKVLNNVKVSDADIKKYAKRLSVFSKKKAIAAIVGGIAILGAGAGTAGYFINNSNGMYQQGVVYIDPVKQSEAEVDYVTDSSNNKIATVTSKKKAIVDVKVIIGKDILTPEEEYHAEAVNSVTKYKVTIFKDALAKHSGVIYVSPIFEDEAGEKVVIMFNTNGGTAIDFKQITKGSKLNEQELKTTKEGCEFVGWYSDENLTEPFDFNTPVTSSMNLYAKWHIPTSSVDYFSFEWYGDGYAVMVNEDKEYELPRYLSIPSTYKGKDVKYLYDPMEARFSPILGASLTSTSLNYSSNGAFEGCSKIVEVELPSTISYIPEYCFRGCYSLKKVILNGGISSIGTSAFAYCSALEEFKFNEGLLDIGEDAFAACTSLKTINLPDSLIRVGDYAFYNCTGLTSAHFGNSLSYIGYDAFCYCYSLSKINLPISLTYISWWAFWGAKITLDETTVSDQYSKWMAEDYDGETIELDPVNKPTEFANYLNNGDCKIMKNGYSSEEENDGLIFHYTGTDENGNYCCSVSYDYDFEWSSLPESITIPETIHFEGFPSTEVVVNKIEDLGFEGNVRFKTITIPSTVTTIGYGAFNYNTNTTKVVIQSDYDTGDYNLKHIGDYAFYASTIYNIWLDDSIQRDYYCVLPEGLTDIGVAAFYNCDFQTVYIPDSLEKISLNGYTSFPDLDGETSITPAFSFAGCPCYFAVYYNENFGSDAQGGFYTLGYTTEGESYKEALVYTTNYEGSTENTTYQIARGTKKIYDTAFIDSKCTYIKTLYIPASLESFNNSLLSDNLSALCQFNVAEEKKVTPHFMVSTDVGEVGLPNMLYGTDDGTNPTEIVAYRPSDETKRSETVSYQVPAGIKSINVGAFKNATNIKSVDFSYAENLESIEAYAFYSTNIRIFDIPETVTELGANCFANAYDSRYYILNSETLMNLTSSEALSAGMLEYATCGIYVPKTLINDVSDYSFVKTLNMELYDEGEESPLTEEIPTIDDNYRYFEYDK